VIYLADSNVESPACVRANDCDDDDETKKENHRGGFGFGHVRDSTRNGNRKSPFNSATNFVIIKGVHPPFVGLKQQNVQQSALQL
jgi:hypothetical protein